MSDTAASEAARELIRRRWGNTRPNRLAHELAARVDELDDEEAELLRAALADREAVR